MYLLDGEVRKGAGEPMVLVGIVTEELLVGWFARLCREGRGAARSGCVYECRCVGRGGEWEEEEKEGEDEK